MVSAAYPLRAEPSVSAPLKNRGTRIIQTSENTKEEILPVETPHCEDHIQILFWIGDEKDQKKKKIPNSLDNKFLLCSTGNYIRYPEINHNGQEYMKKNDVHIFVCITESLCCTAEIHTNIVNQLYFNKIKNK